MARMIALMVICLATMNALAQGSKDPLQLFRKAINSPERENYVLSFEVTYPRDKGMPRFERLKWEYLIRARGEERYSIITRYSIDKQPHGRKMTSHQFNLTAFSITYDDSPFHLEFCTTDHSIEHSHRVDYRKLGRLFYSLGSSNGIPLSEYDRFFTIPFVKKTIHENEIEYTASASYPAEKREYSLLFKDGNTAYPAISKRIIQTKSDTTEDLHLVKCGNDKSFPIEIDFTSKLNGVLTYHQCIRNIKFGPLPADFVFTPTLLNIPINAEAFQDRMRTVYWDGRKFVDRPVPVDRK